MLHCMGTPLVMETYGKIGRRMTRDKVELFQIGWHMDGFEQEEKAIQSNTHEKEDTWFINTHFKSGSGLRHITHFRSTQ